jgi:hypothetical protein
MEPGEVWAYRERKTQPLEPVEYLRPGHGPNSKKVWIRHLNEEMDRFEQAVPPGRLKVPWAQKNQFLSNEQSWANLQAESIVEAYVHRAFELVLRSTLDEMKMELPLKQTYGYAYVQDPGHVADRSGLPVLEITPDDLAPEDYDNFFVPLETVQRIVVALARKHPARVLREVESDQFTKNEAWQLWIDRYHCGPDEIQADQEEGLKTWDLVRFWCGEEAGEQWGNLEEARDKLADALNLLDLALAALDEFGHRGAASELRAYRQGKPLPAELQRPPRIEDLKYDKMAPYAASAFTASHRRRRYWA